MKILTVKWWRKRPVISQAEAIGDCGVTIVQVFFLEFYNSVKMLVSIAREKHNNKSETKKQSGYTKKVSGYSR